MSVNLDHFSGSIVTDSGDLIVNAASGAFRILAQAPQIESVLPQLRFIETTQSNAAGKLRLLLQNDALTFERNTHVSNPFQTVSTIFTIATGSTIVNFGTTPTVGSNAIYHAGNLSLTNIAGTLGVAKGGTGQTTFTAGYLKASGTTAFSTVSSIPETDVANGTLLARVADNETITGFWTYSPVGGNLTINSQVLVKTESIGGVFNPTSGSGSGFGSIILDASGGTFSANAPGAGLIWSGRGTTNRRAAIAMRHTGADNSTGGLSFYTAASGGSSTLTEMMTLSHDGQLRLNVAANIVLGYGTTNIIVLSQQNVQSLVLDNNQSINGFWAFGSGAGPVLNTGSSTVFNSGSTTLFNSGANLSFNNAVTSVGNWTIGSGNWSFGNSVVMTVGSGIIRTFGAADTDITALVSGSTTGLLFEGQNSAHFVIGIRSNDGNDGFYILDKGDAATPATDPYANTVLRVSRTAFQYMGGMVRTTTNFVAGTHYLAPGGSGSGSGLTALNATQLTTGTVPNARMTGIYDGITIKLDGTNTVFGMYGTSARTVYDLVQYRSGSSTATGAIVFTAPAAVTSGIMHQMMIRGYTYVADNRQLMIDCTIFFYRNNTTFTSASIVHRGNWFPMPAFRVGTDASGKTVIVFGDVGTVNPYPHFVCYMASFSHSGAVDSYCFGWTSALVTDLTGYTLSLDYNQSYASGVLHALDTILFSGQGLVNNVDGISFDDSSNVFTFTADSSITSSAISVGMLRLNRTSTITLTGTTHSFQIGDSTGSNLAGDINGIQSRNNGVAATLNINSLGGLVNVGSGGINSSGTIVIENTAPVLLFRDSTAAEAVGRQYVNGNQMVWQASGDELVWTTIMVADLTGNVYFKPVRMNVTATTAIALAVGTAVPFQLGPDTGLNLAGSSNHIQVRNNGVASTLYLNNLGGGVIIGSGGLTVGSGGLNSTGHMTITNSGPQIKLQDTTADQLSGRMRVDANNVYFDSSPDDTAWTEVFRFELDTKISYLGAIRLASTSGVSLTSTAHAFQTGATATENMIIDTNEIQVRNNGAASAVYLNRLGGDINLGNASNAVNVIGQLVMTNGGIAMLGGTYVDYLDCSGDLTMKSGARLQIGGALGGYISAHYYVTQALNFPSVAALGRQILTVTVPGATTGDAVFLGYSTGGPATGVFYTGFVSASSTVSIICQNYTSAAVDPASTTFYIHVVRASMT